MLQAVALRVRVSRLSDPEGKEDVAAGEGAVEVGANAGGAEEAGWKKCRV